VTDRSFTILGAGKLGRALGRLLVAKGWKPRGVTASTLRSARQAAEFIGGGEASVSNPRAAALGGLLLIATPDSAIAPVARELAAGARLAWRGRVVAHTSGALSSAALEPLARVGARTASLHPLASVADPRAGFTSVQGTPFAIEGDPAAVAPLRKMVQGFGGIPVTIPRQAKVLYHLIACLMSNDLVALLSLGLETARGLGLSRKEAARLYLPLVRGTVENVVRLGPVKALTGPVSRGDFTTLRLHGEVLRSLPPDLRRLHRILALRSTAIALEARTISPDVAVQMARLLGSQP
jgi:predicted short-subunit dehydrogenase-like oxidoreductase (DUF2520 family)